MSLEEETETGNETTPMLRRRRSSVPSPPATGIIGRILSNCWVAFSQLETGATRLETGVTRFISVGVKTVVSALGAVVVAALLWSAASWYLLRYGSHDGGFCLVDKGCTGGSVCCPALIFGKLGQCHECCGSPDCIARMVGCEGADCSTLLDDFSFAYPDAGTFGTPYCVDHTCHAFGDGGVATAIPREGYPVFLPSETIDNSRSFHEITIPRKAFSILPGHPIEEQVWHIDFNNQDPELFDASRVVYNGTHIVIPSFDTLHAGYSRSYHQYDEHETGIVTLIGVDNYYSVVADYPKIGFVEKYHTLTYDGKKDTARADYIRQKAREQHQREEQASSSASSGATPQPPEKPHAFWKWLFPSASSWSRRWFRHAYPQAVALLGSNVYAQMEACVDRAVAWQVRRYAGTYPPELHGSVNPSSTEAWALHSRRAQQAIVHARNETFERVYPKSEQHCKHFERLLHQADGTSGVGYTDDTIAFPLGRPVTMVTGEIINSPTYYLGVGVGIATVHYDPDTHVLELYFRAHSYAREYSDPHPDFRGPYETALYVSPVAEGPEYAVDPSADGRGDGVFRAEPPPDGTTDDTTDADFTLWNRPVEEVCANATKTGSFWTEIDVLKAEKGIASIFDMLVQFRHVLKGIVRGMPCAQSWMVGDFGNDTHGFGANEIGVWIHTLGEVRDDQTRRIGLADWWDSWECFYRPSSSLSSSVCN